MNALLASLRLLPLLLAASSLAPPASALSLVDWTSPSQGIADGIQVTIGGLGSAHLDVVDLSGEFYESAPLAADTEVLSYAASSDWNLLVSEPLDALLVYVYAWRGIAAGVEQPTYVFDAPFVDFSGLNASGSEPHPDGGYSLVLRNDFFHYGILLFCGPIQELAVDTNLPALNQSAQVLTLALVPLPENPPTVKPVDWEHSGSGKVGAISVALENLQEPFGLGIADYGGPGFAAEPLSFCTDSVHYGVHSDWQLTLSHPVAALDLYARQWRGDTDSGPVTYQFDRPATIVSGLAGATLSSGNTLLSLPPGQHDGILRFEGPLAALSVASNAEAFSGRQAMTFAQAGPAIFTWPSETPPCDGTLEACIDAAAPGDVIEIASEGPHDVGVVVIEKGLTLRAAPGVEPVVAPLGSLFFSPVGDGDHHVRVEGLRFANGRVRVAHGAEGALDVAIIRNRFDAALNDEAAIDVFSNGPTGPLRFEIADNRLVVQAGTATQGIAVGGFGDAAVEGAIRGNRITMGPNGQGAAISITSSEVPMAVDVFSNVIDGEGYDEGISAYTQGAGAMALRIANNVVSGAGGEDFSREAIQIYANSGPIDVQIVNNTLVENHTAIGIGGRSDLGGAFDGLVANNVMAGNVRGLNVDPGAGTIPDRNNLYFANDIDLGDGEQQVTPGPNSIFGMDPLLVAGEDHRPLPGSPVVDAGDTTAVPPDLAGDVAGAPRIRGGVVDIGAHEVPEPGIAAAGGAAAAVLLVLARARRAPPARA